MIMVMSFLNFWETAFCVWVGWLIDKYNETVKVGSTILRSSPSIPTSKVDFLAFRIYIILHL